MSGEWKNSEVEKVFDLISGFAFKSRDFISDGIPVIKIKNIKAGFFSKHEFSYVSSDFLDSRPDKVAQPNDLLISMSGNRHDGSPETWVGKVAMFREDGNYFVNQRVGVLRVKDEEFIDPRFASYLLSSWYYQQLFISIATSSGGQANLSPTQILSARFRHPDIDTQKRIAHILGTLDDKIELNRRMNQTLEAMAQAIFQSWFVDFDPVRAKMRANELGCNPEHAAMAAIAGKLRLPRDLSELTKQDFTTAEAALTKLSAERRASLAKTAALFPDSFQDSELGEIPEGWEVRSFSQICDINPRRTLKKNSIATYLDMKSVPTEGPSPIGTIQREFKSGTKFINGDTLLARITPCLENGKTAFVDFLEVGETGWGSTEFIVIHPKKNIPTSLGYFFARSESVRSHAIQSMIGTSGRQRVAKDAFDHLQVASPPSTTIYQRFGSFSETIMAKIQANAQQSRTLAELRDTLLPKLLSGELNMN